MIIGVDKGSAYTKTSKEFMVKSTVRKLDENDISINSNDVVEFCGDRYIIGEEGDFATDLMKQKHNNTKILVYTAIAQSFDKDYIKTDLVLGLPIGLFSRHKNEMNELFEKDKLLDIKVNGVKKAIVISNVVVFPEAAATFYVQDKNDCLIIDIGGLSIDMAYFKNRKLVKHSTYSMGMMKLLSKIANEINSEHDLSLSEWTVEDVLNDGLYVYGQKQDIGAEYIISQHCNEIVRRIKLEYDVKGIRNIVLTGGGSSMCYDFMKQHMPQSYILENNQFSNAKGFELIGKSIFKDV